MDSPTELIEILDQMKTTSSTASHILRSRTRNMSSQPLSTIITEERNGHGSIIRTTTVRYSNGSEFSSKEFLAPSNEVLVPLEDSSSNVVHRRLKTE